jgi:hypothetical protein
MLDHLVLEPVIRRLFPEPPERRIGARVLHAGDGGLRFLCLSGAFCSDTARNWSGWIKALRRAHPGAGIAVLNGFYYYWEDEDQVIRQIMAAGTALLADRRPTIILAFSFGGLLAKGIVDSAPVQDVRAVVTLATEHRRHLPRIAHMRDVALRIPREIACPLYSFGGWFDPIVWPWTTFTSDSTHRFLANGHFAFMHAPRTRGGRGSGAVGVEHPIPEGREHTVIAACTGARHAAAAAFVMVHVMAMQRRQQPEGQARMLMLELMELAERGIAEGAAEDRPDRGCAAKADGQQEKKQGMHRKAGRERQRQRLARCQMMVEMAGHPEAVENPAVKGVFGEAVGKEAEAGPKGGSGEAPIRKIVQRKAEKAEGCPGIQGDRETKVQLIRKALSERGVAHASTSSAVLAELVGCLSLFAVYQ